MTVWRTASIGGAYPVIMCGNQCGNGDQTTVAMFAQLLVAITELRVKVEQHMSQETEAFTALNAKVDDLIADVRAALEALVAAEGNLSPEGQAEVDALNAKLDAFDAEIGDADGSDTPPPPVEPTPV